MTFVLDASMAATWILPNEVMPSANAIFEKLETEEALSPTLFWFEIRQVLIRAERRERLSVGEALSIMQKVSALPLVDAGRGDDTSILTLAQKHTLSAYGASYLSLAISERAPLATLDKSLAQAARAERVEVLGPLAES